MPQNQSKQMHVSTQIRNFYSNGIAYMNTKFYNMQFMITLYPFSGKDQNGLSKYDANTSVSSTIGPDGAFGLYYVGNKIIEGSVDEIKLNIPCYNGEMILERKQGQNGYETTLYITKNNMTLRFVFPVMQSTITENGVTKQITVETGLGGFLKTLDGYLTGINADRHLDKLTEEYSKLMGNNNNDNQQWNNQQSNKRFNNYNNNQRQYNGQPRQYNGQPKQNNWGGSNQGFDNYNVSN